MRSTDFQPHAGARRAVIALPFGRMRLTCTADVVLLLEYLAPDAPIIPPESALCRDLAAQLQAYCTDPAHAFSLPLADSGTAFQRRVRSLLQQIPCGQTRTYGDAATELHSAARAVGQACAANPFAPIVPCHRIVASQFRTAVPKELTPPRGETRAARQGAVSFQFRTAVPKELTPPRGETCAASQGAVSFQGLGGFAHSTATDGHLLAIKRWLLRHEGAFRHA